MRKLFEETLYNILILPAGLVIILRGVPNCTRLGFSNSYHRLVALQWVFERSLGAAE